MFYLEKLRQRALHLISEYSSFDFYFCFSLTFSKLQTCALTWCCPGHTITILQISKLLTKRIWSIFWFITWFSLLYALTHWHPNPNWYPEISGMSWGAKISNFGPLCTTSEDWWTRTHKCKYNNTKQKTYTINVKDTPKKGSQTKYVQHVLQRGNNMSC